MIFRILADAVVVVHLGFIVFVALGVLVVYRWPRLAPVHIAAVAWSLGSVTIGFLCPLTPLEKRLRHLAGDRGYHGGFVDQYIEDVVYPQRYSSLLRVLIAVSIVAGYLALYRRSERAG